MLTPETATPPPTDSATPQKRAPRSSAAASSNAPLPGIIESLKALWSDVRGIAHYRLELVALETQRAAESLVAIIVYGLVAGLLLVSAWLGLGAALILALIQLGLAPALSILLVVLANLVGAYVCFLAIRRKSKNLRFPATIASLRSADQTRPEISPSTVPETLNPDQSAAARSVSQRAVH